MKFNFQLNLRNRLGIFQFSRLNENDLTPSNSKTWFVLYFFIATCWLLLMEPSWIFGGEMWAEMATNYYANSLSSDPYYLFFSLDFGYLPLPQRILAAIPIFLKFPAASIPYIYTLFAIFCSILMVGAFISKKFAFLVKSNLVRFTVSLIIFFSSTFDLRTFVNFTYFGFFSY